METFRWLEAIFTMFCHFLRDMDENHNKHLYLRTSDCDWMKTLHHKTAAVKHGGGGVMVWGFFAASEPGTDGSMNGAEYQKTGTESSSSGHELSLKNLWVLPRPQQHVCLQMGQNIFAVFN